MLRITSNYMEDQRLLASVALFRKLYDNKKDSYDVLAEFLRASININCSWNFTVDDCSDNLKKSFGFKIPTAVIKSCLRRRMKGEIELSRGIFTTTEKFQKSESLHSEISAAQTEQETIIKQLVDFVVDLGKKTLCPTEEQQLRTDFHQYFLGGLKPGKNHVYISQFILKNSKYSDFTEKLNHLEEGLILYQGIEYSPDIGQINSWRENFTIYLDTEILFWAIGYDGELFKTIFTEFIDLVREMNLKASNDSKITIKYFPETRQEVDSFFKAAEHIITGGRFSDPSRTAMQHLLKGCRAPSDIIEKKVVFYSSLTKLKIYEEKEHNYYDPPDYNCESSDLLNQLTQEFPDVSNDKIANSLKFFTKINYLRKGISNKGLEKSNSILASGKNISRSLACHPQVLQMENSVPFSTDLEYLTERIWFKLGKGFGSGVKTLAAFDVVARAQLVIATQISSKVSSDYKSLISKVSSGELSTNDASYIVSDLKSRPVKPEELNADNIEIISEYLDNDSIEANVRKIRLLEGKAEELEKKNLSLAEANKKIESYEIKEHLKKISEWRSEIKKMKGSAKIKYKAYLLLIILAPIILILAIAFVLSSNNDSLLSLVGFALTAAAFFWPFVSVKFIHRILLKRLRSTLKKNIQGYTPRPRLEN